ncbi:MAG: phosphate signaling complex protein PhoU [Gammaproteobacteria bacterium]
MSHYEERLEHDLSEIRGRVELMSKAVRNALDDSVKALLSGEQELAYATVLQDARINESMRDIDGLCHRFIARHLPSAGHLRLISAVIRTALQLERIGDYAVIIARESVQLAAPPSGPMARQLETTVGSAQRMLGQSLDAFNESNEQKARVTMDMGESLEGIMDHIYADLLAASEAARVKDLVALFVVFSHLKRVTDLAKNVCEETVFVTTGETKAGRIHDVLFVDEDDSALGQMACAIAERTYPGVARFASAGREPAERIDAELERFLGARGYDLSAAHPTRLDASPNRISQYFVVVSLDGPIKRYLTEVPFHTSVFEWDVGGQPRGLSGDAATDRYEALYRELSSLVRELVEMLSGREAP